MIIHLHIQEFVLSELPIEIGNTSDFQSIVEVELKRLISSGGLVPGLLRNRTIESVSSKEFEHTDKETPPAFGQLVAKAVYGGINQ